ADAQWVPAGSRRQGRPAGTDPAATQVEEVDCGWWGAPPRRARERHAVARSPERGSARAAGSAAAREDGASVPEDGERPGVVADRRQPALKGARERRPPRPTTERTEDAVPLGPCGGALVKDDPCVAPAAAGVG